MHIDVSRLHVHVVCFSPAFGKLFLTANVIQSDTKIFAGKTTFCLPSPSWQPTSRCRTSNHDNIYPVAR